MWWAAALPGSRIGDTQRNGERESEMADETRQEKNEEGAQERASDFQAEAERSRKEMEEFQARDELPSDLKEWPDGKAKYITFDAEGEDAYGDGLTEKLGPPVKHHDDGSVSINGEKVDNPEDYKGEPIPLALETSDPDKKKLEDESAE